MTTAATAKQRCYDCCCCINISDNGIEFVATVSQFSIVIYMMTTKHVVDYYAVIARIIIVLICIYNMHRQICSSDYDLDSNDEWYSWFFWRSILNGVKNNPFSNLIQMRTRKMRCITWNIINLCYQEINFTKKCMYIHSYLCINKSCRARLIPRA